MKLEIGGGTRNRGEGWTNLDLCDTADVRHDLNVIPWPFADQSADEIYTSHCIEHVKSPVDFIRESARIGKIGARVTIHCPDPMAEMAMCAGHESTFSINQVRHFDIFPDVWWTGERRLKLLNIEYGPDDYWFPRARNSSLFAGWSDRDIMDWIPRTKHENRFHFEVVAR